MHGCTFVPIILGSDKTTVSVATGQHEYYPIYLSIGNVHNDVRRAHKDALVLIRFLPIPKGPRKETDNDEFRDFRRRLFHGCLKQILQKLRQYITKWDLVRCADDHFRRVVYGIGPYIADYPEQVLVADIVNGWCPVYVNLLALTLVVPSLTIIAVTRIQQTSTTLTPSHEHQRQLKSFSGQSLLMNYGTNMVSSMIFVYVSCISRVRYH